MKLACDITKINTRTFSYNYNDVENKVTVCSAVLWVYYAIKKNSQKIILLIYVITVYILQIIITLCKCRF